MSNEIDWAKAPEGATHYEPPYESGVCGAFVKTVSVGSGWRWWNGSVWQCHLGMTEERRATLIERTSKSWTGQGLPPVGTVCEFCGGDPDPVDPWHVGLKDGATVTVIAHYDNNGCDVAVFTFEDLRQSVYGMQVDQAVAGCFRPIRTQAQIEAEERKHAIDAMSAATQGAHNWIEAFGKLHDAGYRKTEVGK